MIFKRRDKRGTRRLILETVYPPGGWGRAFNYVYHRLRRLPDPPHRIARGVAAGMFVTCSPFFGLHIFLAAFVGWVVRGNVLASMLATFVGNPLTFPFIAAASLTTGNWLLGRIGEVPLHVIPKAFRHASADLWWNVQALFNHHAAHWDGLDDFFEDIFLPYLLGGAVNGLILAVVAYLLARPLIEAYRRRRSRLLQQKLQARLGLKRRSLVK